MVHQQKNWRDGTFWMLDSFSNSKYIRNLYFYLNMTLFNYYMKIKRPNFVSESVEKKLVKK